MRMSAETLDTAVLWLDEQPFSSNAVVDALRMNNQLPSLISELILNETLSNIHIDSDFEDNLLAEYKSKNELLTDDKYMNYLKLNLLDEKLLRWSLSRPYRIISFREERWGARVNTLYLKHKEKFDTVVYRCLQSSNADLMQEVFFRLKDKEESWESLARQFPGAQTDSAARMGPIQVHKIEPLLLEALRKYGPKRIIKPINIKGKFTVAELENFNASKLDDELRTELLKEEFGNWLQEESTKMIKTMRLPQ